MLSEFSFVFASHRGKVVKKIVLAIAILGLLAGLASPTHAVQNRVKSYSNCDQLLKKYPNGVADSKRAAAKAVKSGNVRPKVSASLYKSNSKRLDTDKDGVMCEQRADSDVATEVAVAPQAQVWSLTDTSTWSQAEKDFTLYLTSVRSNNRADLLWLCTDFADAAYDASTISLFDASADKGVQLFNIDRSHARQIVWQYWDKWCYALFYLHVRKVYG